MRYLILILIILANLAWATPTRPTAPANQPINVIYYHQTNPNALDKISVDVWSTAAKILNINVTTQAS